MKKTILLALTLSLLLASCGGNAPKELAENTVPSEETLLTEETTKKYADNIPEDLTFDGQTITFLIENVMAKNDLTGEIGGDIAMDAVYNRNLKTEERFNVKIQSDIKEMSHPDIANLVRQSVLADAEPYNVYLARALEAITLSIEGMLVETKELPYIDINQPWWQKDYAQSIALNSNEIYALPGDICISTFMYSNVLFFNKQDFTDRFGDYNEQLYDVVFDGKWTYDVFMKYLEQSYTDTNGNGTTDNEDYYGFVYLDYAQGWYFLSAGLEYVSRDEEGYPVLELYNDRIVKLAETLSDLFNTPEYGLRCDGTYNNTLGKFLVEGQCLFLPARFNFIDWNLREMEDPFGCLPYPKIDENAEYASGSANSGNFVTVPNNNTELNMISAVVEALCAEGNASVFPTYYENALKIKYTDGGSDAKMIDLIRDSTMDFVLGTASHNGSSIGYLIGDVVMNNQGSEYTSYYNAQIGAKNEMLKNIITTYKNNRNLGD